MRVQQPSESGQIMPQISDVLEGKGYQLSVRGYRTNAKLGQDHCETLKTSSLHLLTKTDPASNTETKRARSNEYDKSSPQLSIERAELNGLGNVVAGNCFRTSQVSNRPRHFQDTVIGPRA